jgi:hypothetical protein
MVATLEQQCGASASWKDVTLHRLRQEIEKAESNGMYGEVNFSLKFENGAAHTETISITKSRKLRK